MRTIRKRRMQGLTNYRKRVALLKGGLPRLIVRKSNRNIRVQIVKYSENGDLTIAFADSRELKSFGWLPKRNTPTAYLTGALVAKKAGKLKIQECILDIGLYKPTKASILFAAARGAIDNGLKVRSNIEFDESRINGSHIKAYSEIAKDDKRFSLYTKNNIQVSQITELFNKTSTAIKEKG